jgi:hypothetical protein
MMRTPRVSERAASLALPFAVLRARQWAHFVVLPLAAIDPALLEASPREVALRAARGVTLAALSLAYAYGLNAISDRATDLDRAKNPLAGGACPPRVSALVVATAGAALVLAMASGRATLAAVALSLASSTVYSVGPRLKALPVVGTLLNAGIFAPLLCFAVADEAPRAVVVLGVVFTAMLLQNQLLHESADAAEDAAARSLTTGRVVSAAAVPALVIALGGAGALACAAVAPSHAFGWACAGALAATTAGGLVSRAPGPTTCSGSRRADDPAAQWRARRAAHRWVAFAAGAVLFATTFLGAAR